MSFRSIFNENSNYVYVIAEIGGNFTTYEEAVKLIDGAKFAGVDCVKLQTYRAETIVAKSAMFDMENTKKISQYDYFKKYELSEKLHRDIFNHVESQGLDWFSTPSHRTDVDMLEALGSQAYKIGGDDAVNIPLLKYIAKLGKPIFLSTGMCTLEEVKESVNSIVEEGNRQIVIFHTVSGYPTHPKDVNLNVLKTLMSAFPEFVIGFSDHTQSPLASIAAASIGAKVIERHFTLDKNAEGPDHMLSSTPDEMKYLVESIRSIEIMMGSGEKKPFGPEVQNRINNRKSILAIKDIEKGEKLSADNIDVKRPGSGIAPKHYFEIQGKIAKRKIKLDEILKWEDFQ
jgi:N,N'-diacetyllegionaminate synthase